MVETAGTIQEEAPRCRCGRAQPPAPVEFEPEEASASYRIDPSAPSEFRFAAPSSSVVEEEELAPEAEDPFPEPDLIHAGAGRPAFRDQRTGDCRIRRSYAAPAELETEFDELEDDLDALQRPRPGWLRKKRSRTKRSMTLPLFMSRAKTTTCRSWKRRRSTRKFRQAARLAIWCAMRISNSVSRAKLPASPLKKRKRKTSLRTPLPME